MTLKTILLKLWMSFLLYMMIYNTIIFVTLHPYLSPREWLFKPLVDIYYFNCFPIVILVFVFCFCFTHLFFDATENIKKRLKSKETIERTRDAEKFFYAVSILKNTRFSHVLNENAFIEIQSLQYLFYKIESIKELLE